MRREFRADEIAFLKEVSPGKTYAEIADAFNARFRERDYVMPHQVKSAMKYRKIPYSGQAVTAARHVPVGSVNIAPYGTRKNGDRHRYEMVKVAEPNVWKRKSLVVWEEHYGPLPEGKMIVFLDGNTLNSDIDNLYAVSPEVHFRLNKYRVMKPSRDYMLAAIQVAELEDTIKRAKKNRKRNEKKEERVRDNDHCPPRKEE